MEEILTCTRMGEELCNTGCQQFPRPDVVSLPAFDEDGWCYKNFISGQQVINMRGLLSDGFAHHIKEAAGEKLPLVPRLLLVTVPQFAHDESGTTFYLSSDDVRSDWGDGVFD